MNTSRALVMIAAFAAIYIVWGFASSIALRSITLSVDLFFLIAALFALLEKIVARPWSATTLGLIAGVVFLGTPAPNAWHITLSLIANGVIFDLWLLLAKRTSAGRSRLQIIIAATLGNFVMGIVGLSAFQAAGAPVPLLFWAFLVVITTVAGTAGAAFGLAVAGRVKRGSTTVQLPQKNRTY